MSLIKLYSIYWNVLYFAKKIKKESKKVIPIFKEKSVAI